MKIRVRMTLQAKHKLGIGITVAILAIVIALGVTGALVAIHQYHLQKGSTDVGSSNPPADQSTVSDNVKISKTGFIPPPKASLSEIVALAKYNGVYTHYADQQTNPISTAEDQNPASHHITGMTTNVFSHADGVVYAVVQSENTRTVQGINCLEQIMFQTNTGLPLNTNGTNVCSGMDVRSATGFNGFHNIIIGNRSSTTANTLNGSDTVTTSKIGGTRASTIGGLILTASANQGGPSSGTTAGTPTYNQITITSGTYSFTGIKSSGEIITMAFLSNNTSATDTLDAAFAENSFTGISVANTDTMVVTWTITVT